MERKVYLKLMALDAARALWLEKLDAAARTPLGHERVPLRAARGRTLAESAVARLSSPAFHGAAMDGIAVRAEDTFGASEQRPRTLRLGENAFWINTGQPLPQQANAVIMIEHTVASPDGKEARIEKAAFPWQHVRKMGEDMVSTEVLLPPGTLVGPYELGAMAAAGVLPPVVFKRPKVRIIPSGSELVSLEEADPEQLRSGAKLPEFNSFILSALVEDAGGEAEVADIVPDAPDAISQALLEAVESDADLVVINAGSSAGSHDYTAEIIAAQGELWVHGVSVMPGKPTALGLVRGKPVMGTPGYPVSAIIAFEELGQPLLALWQKRRMPERALDAATPYQAIPSRPGMEERVRVKLGRVDERLFAVTLPRGSGTVTSLSRADGIISIPANTEGLSAEREAPVTLIRSRAHIEGALLAIGSHDNALDLLDSFLRRAHPRYSLTSAHVGSLGGIMALKNRRCHLAGCHLLDAASGAYNRAAIAEHLRGIPVMLLRLADREQGLIVPPGNPMGLAGLADLAREDVRFINRQRGSGTRVLLDWHLGRLGIDPDAVKGYEDEEYTHMNVAAAVLSGRVATGLGVRAAANALGLDFLPVGVEEYDLVIPTRYWEDARMQALLDVVRSPEYIRSMEALGGYGTAKTGEVVWEFPGE